MGAPPHALNPIDLLAAYASGIFPMAESVKDDDVFWVDPDYRGILPLHAFHLPRRLKRRLRQNPFRVTINSDFGGTMRACQAPTADRPESWINETILHAYTELHMMGHAHSIECYQDEELVGGLYGVSLAGAFFGESMFSRATDASKIALTYLVARLKHGGFSLLDCQFKTDHLAQFGVVEVPRGRYHTGLQTALEKPGNIYSLPEYISPEEVLQIIGQTS